MFYRFYVKMKQNGSCWDVFGLKRCEDICHCLNVVWYILTQVLEVVNHLAFIIQKPKKYTAPIMFSDLCKKTRRTFGRVTAGSRFLF